MRTLFVVLAMVATFAVAAASSGSSTPVAEECPARAQCPGCGMDCCN